MCIRDRHETDWAEQLKKGSGQTPQENPALLHDDAHLHHDHLPGGPLYRGYGLLGRFLWIIGLRMERPPHLDVRAVSYKSSMVFSARYSGRFVINDDAHSRRPHFSLFCNSFFHIFLNVWSRKNTFFYLLQCKGGKCLFYSGFLQRQSAAVIYFWASLSYTGRPLF